MDKFIYLLCGPSSSGKSTWAAAERKYNDEVGDKGSTIIISRDKIRFSLLEDGDSYFSHENEVFDKFINKINNAIKNPKYDRIIIDATHITPKSRAKVLNLLNLEGIIVVAVNFITPIDDAIEGNAARKGRAKVDEEVIRSMYAGFKPATENEKFINKVINIERK